MLDEFSTAFRYDLAKEIFDVLKHIFDARNQRRAKIFAREIAPMMQKMRANHTDFLDIISILKVITNRMSIELDENKNDLENGIIEIISELQSLLSIRAKRRVERREMFEEAIWQHGRLNQGHEFRSISLSQEEADTMSSFYDLVSKYFSADNRVYSHDIHSLVNSVCRSARLMQTGTQRREKLLQQIQYHQICLSLYEQRLEDSWGGIARSFAGLKQLE